MESNGIYFIESLPGFEGYVIDSNGMATYTSGFEKYVIPRSNRASGQSPDPGRNNNP